jgi:hypothetical protein
MASMNKRTKNNLGVARAIDRMAFQIPTLNVACIKAYASTDSERQLRRLVGACMLWEKQFYVDGKDIATQIREQVALVEPEVVSQIAVDAREINKLRHAPLLIVREMARLPRHKSVVADTLFRVIQRPDEITEFLAIYWQTELPVPNASRFGLVRSMSKTALTTVSRKSPLSAQVKKGLAKAFTKFSEYQLAKYDRDGDIKLRDVMFLVHAKPTTPAQAALFQKVASRTLATPNTWETRLSAGENKREVFEDLIQTGQLGGLALLRNLRNMKEAKVQPNLIRQAIVGMDTTRILPFRFIAAARFAPEYEPELEQALFNSIASQSKFPGHTVVLVDHSGSMDTKLSEKSDMTRFDAATGVAMVLRERTERVSVYSFSDTVVPVPARRGFALRDAIASSQGWSGTALGAAVNHVNARESYDRLVIITDEQQTDRAQARPLAGRKGYVINVASSAQGLSYADWLKVDGFSEAVINFLADYEANVVNS